jgi:DNA-binding NarL/FixJ family response regulator
MNGMQAARAIHTVDPRTPMLLFTLTQIGEELAQQVRDAGFHGALAKGEGMFALSQAVEALLQGKTFFIPDPSTQLAC